MGLFTRLFVSSAVAGAGAAYISQNYIYVGEYHETPPFNSGSLPFVSKLKYKVYGLNDDVDCNISSRIVNPHGNPAIYDYFEKQLDTESTKKILSKYKTNDEILGAMQKALFLGPTLWPHRFIISPYLKSKDPNNRFSGFTYFEPTLKTLDLTAAPKIKPFGFPLLPTTEKLPYVWDSADIKKYTHPFPAKTVIFGMFSMLESGKRSNGGYFNFAFGSDLIDGTAIHRAEYFTVKNSDGEDNLVFRFTNVTLAIPPNSPAPTDNTNGLHEFMTRTMVLDMVRGIEY